MIDRNVHRGLVQIMQFHTREIANTLRARLDHPDWTGQISSSVWSNEAGLIVGSVSIYTRRKPAEESIDGVLTLMLEDDGLTISADVCCSNGTILFDVLDQKVEIAIPEKLLGVVEATFQAVVPLLISGMMTSACEVKLGKMF